MINKVLRFWASVEIPKFFDTGEENTLRSMSYEISFVLAKSMLKKRHGAWSRGDFSSLKIFNLPSEENKAYTFAFPNFLLP